MRSWLWLTVMAFVALMFGSGQVNTFGQVTVQKRLELPSSCEYFSAVLDSSIIEHRRLSEGLSGKESFLILIFKPGQLEKQKTIEARIAKIRKHLQVRGQDLASTIFAVGERTSGLGKLEIYLDGKLFGELLFVQGRGAEICRE
jgi:hypothetical protein